MPQQLAPEEIRDEIFKTLLRDRGKLSTAQYPGYKGELTVPMSAMTQRARSLQDTFASLPAPYAGAIQSTATRPTNAFSPQRINDQLTSLGRSHDQFAQNKVLGTLRDQFRQNYDPRVGRFQGKTLKDMNMGLAETERGLQNIGTASSTLSQKRNQSLVDTLSNLQSQKQSRRNMLVNNLEQFGAQQHGYGNLKNRVQQNAFNQELQNPYQRLQMLQQAGSPLGGNLDEMHPDLQKLYGMEGAAALRAYGADPSKPMGAWGQAGGGAGGYKGDLVADLPPEIAASQNILGRMSPQFQESTYGNRKDLMNRLTGQPDLGEQALGGVQEKMNPYVASLESAANKRIKQDMAAINNKYISINQYGSPQHIREAEERAREISKATMEERSKLLQNTLKEQLSLGHEGQIGDIRQLGTYGNLAQKEFGDVVGNIRNLNQRGATKWGNKQAENEALYKSYQNEALWQYPHMREGAKSEAMRDIFGDIGKRDISLDQLYNLDTRYSELQKENQGLLAGQNELQSVRDLNDQLQRQIALLNSRILPATSSSTSSGSTSSSPQMDYQGRLKYYEPYKVQAEADKARRRKELDQTVGGYRNAWLTGTSKYNQDLEALQRRYSSDHRAPHAYQRLEEAKAKLIAARNGLTPVYDQQRAPVEAAWNEAEKNAEKERMVWQHWLQQGGKPPR